MLDINSSYNAPLYILTNTTLMTPIQSSVFSPIHDPSLSPPHSMCASLTASPPFPLLRLLSTNLSQPPLQPPATVAESHNSSTPYTTITTDLENTKSRNFKASEKESSSELKAQDGVCVAWLVRLKNAGPHEDRADDSRHWYDGFLKERRLEAERKGA